ncbi:uncharacterized GMC-type oxidoreductase Mb1310-like isoform X2 [Bacillus rossius redtenbacheri]|uniref:uncharacterized GMC-type oxidoreductase Mb1310-like isoform X2 n=1 Tax=Bacillus rossius redtenbacheri TaxID=93214 RepID=UPI002FDE6AFC
MLLSNVMKYNSLVFYISLSCVTLFQLWVYFSYVQDVLFERLMEIFEEPTHSYDYIVVGGGSAGCVLAGRLAASPGTSVLLLEAGPAWSSWLAAVPALTPLLQGSAVDWRYRTVPQRDACLALHNNESAWPRGRLLGGSARLNNLVYLRGHARDYQSWGHPDWSLPRLLPLFRRLERDAVPVGELPWETPLAAAVLAGGRELGHAVVDLNSGRHTGFMRAPVNMARGRRFSVEQALLKDGRRRQNLKILTHALVDKVLFHGGFEARGVSYLRFGRPHRARARRGVVLCAGTVGSAAVLLRSGVGPRRHLRSLQVPVLHELPVGQSLQDHVTTGLDLVLLNSSLPLGAAALASLPAAWQYLRHGSGPWTSPGCEAVAVLRSGAGGDAPDLQLMVVPAGASSDGGAHLRHNFHLSDSGHVLRGSWSVFVWPLEERDAPGCAGVARLLRGAGRAAGGERAPRGPAPAQPRHGASEGPGPAQRAAHRPALPLAPARRRGPAARGAPGAAAGGHGRPARPGRRAGARAPARLHGRAARLGRLLALLRTARHALRLPPGRHLPHGARLGPQRRRGLPPRGARNPQAVRGRRVRDAQPAQR